MNAFQNCQSTSDLIPLYLPLQLYLKPIARLNMSIQLPKMKKLGKSISHWEIMDKLRDLIKPDEFTVLKVTKTTIEFVRFEGEVETRNKLKNVISKTENKMIRLKDFNDLLRIRVMEWKSDFPNRQVWDDFFQNCKDMDEMKPGERPDTVYFSNLPTKWFVPLSTRVVEDLIPSEKILHRIFEKFGSIRFIDIPICDPYRKKMKSHISGFKDNSNTSEYFECYVQFKDYIGFSKTMDAFRDMKLVHKDDSGAIEIGIKIDFDKSKHLSDASITRREIVRDRLIKKVKEKEAKEQAEFEEKKRNEGIERQREVNLKQQKELRRKLREEKRKAQILEKLEVSGTDEINEKIAKEEKKLLRVQRKLEAIRLVEELFVRIKVSSTDDIQRSDAENDELRRFKNASELEVLTQREKLHHAIKGRAMLKNLLFEGKKKMYSSASDSSLSLDGDDTKKKALVEKYPELLYDPTWFGFRYHLPPGSILSDCSDFSPIGGSFPRGRNSFERFRGMIYTPRGIFNRRGNSQRRFRGGNRGIRRRYPPEIEEEYKKYFAKFLNERSSCRDRNRSYSPSYHNSRRTRSRSRSSRRSYSRSYSRSPSRRSPDRKTRSRSPRSKSRHTPLRSRSIDCSPDIVNSESSRKSETRKGTRKRSKPKNRKSRDKSVNGSIITTPKKTSERSQSNTKSLSLERERWSKSPEK